jgi:hypothetical protein
MVVWLTVSACGVVAALASALGGVLMQVGSGGTGAVTPSPAGGGGGATAALQAVQVGLLACFGCHVCVVAYVGCWRRLVVTGELPPVR